MDVLKAGCFLTSFVGLIHYRVLDEHLQAFTYPNIISLINLLFLFYCSFVSIPYSVLNSINEPYIQVEGAKFTLGMTLIMYALTSLSLPIFLRLNNSLIVSSVNHVLKCQPELLKPYFSQKSPTVVCFLYISRIYFFIMSAVFIYERSLAVAYLLNYCIFRMYMNGECFFVHVYFVASMSRAANSVLTYDSKFISNEALKKLVLYEEAIYKLFEVLNNSFGLGNFLFFWSMVFVFSCQEVLILQRGCTYFQSYGTVMILVIYFLSPIFIVIACSSAAKQAEKTASLLHEIFIENDDPLIREEVEIFSLQLLHRKIEFTAWDFFKLDFTLLYSMIGVVATYIIILIQFQSDKK